MSTNADPCLRPSAELDGLRASHQTLAEQIAGISNAQAREPSGLPGWTRGHLLTHIARNADSVTRRLEGAARNEVLDQYVGGKEGRARAIEEGAARDASDLIADVLASSSRCDAAFAAMPDDAWGRAGRNVAGQQSPVSGLALQRWKEVEIHLVDLQIGYAPSAWPADFVTAALPSVLRTLKHRTDPALLLGWAINRNEAPDLGPW